MNYFEYFSEIEERFSRRRGSVLLLSTLDWALIETWRAAGIPLEAVLRGIDAAFDKHDARAAHGKGRLRKVNGLAWCAQAVLEAAEEQVEAATGAPASAKKDDAGSGFEQQHVAAFIAGNAAAVAAAEQRAPQSAGETLAVIAGRLRALAEEMRSASPPRLDELDGALTVLEEQMLAALRAGLTAEEAIRLREDAARELTPFRGRMNAAQMKQVETQFEQKRLLERWQLPRLSLFYMGHA